MSAFVVYVRDRMTDPEEVSRCERAEYCVFIVEGVTPRPTDRVT